MNNIHKIFKKHTCDILSIVSSIGVIGTSILAVKATPKAINLIEFEKKEKNIEKLSIYETIKLAWKPYIPSFCMGISTILCIFGSNYLHKRYQKNLIAAYTVLNNSYLQYRNNIKKIYGNDSDKKILKESIKNIEEYDDGLELFFDCQSMQYFRNTYDNIKKCEKIFNEHLSNNGCASLNEFYELIGIPVVKYGYDIGWSTYLNDQIYGRSGIDIKLELTEIDDLKCWIMDIECQPTTNFIY